MLKKHILTLNFFLGLLAVAFIFLFCAQGLTGYISDSELWPISLAKNIKEEWYHPWVFTRPLFFLITALASYFPQSAYGVFLSVKIVYLIIGLLIIALTHALASIHSKGESTLEKICPILALVLLTTHSSFQNQGYRIRSDILACALLLFLAIKISKGQRGIKIKDLPHWSLPLLATPKAVLQIAPLFLLEKNRKQKIFAAILLFFGASLVAAMYPAGIEYLKKSVLDPVDYPKYFSIERFMYIERSMNMNGLFWFLFLLRTITFPYVLYSESHKDAELKKNGRRFFFFTIFLFFILLFSPEKVPFHIATFIPVFSIFVAFLWQDISIIIDKHAPAQFVNFYRNILLFSIFLTAIAMASSGYKNWKRFYKEDSWEAQVNNIRVLDDFLAKYPKAEYFDVIGIIPGRATMRVFVGPNDPEVNSQALNSIIRRQPHLIFFVAKLSLLGPYFYDFLKTKYVHLAGGVYAKLFFIDNAKATLLSIGKLLAASSEELGISPPQIFTAIISTKKERNIKVETTLHDLWAKKRKDKNFTLIAITPFTVPNPPPVGLPYVFNFDSEY